MRAGSLRRRGWMMVDALLSMAVIVIIATALAASMAQQRKAQIRLAESREAVRFAERALVALQAVQAAPTPPDGTDLQVLTPQAERAPSGWKWVTIHVTHKGRTSALSGLVPDGGAR